jgi:hypothetical protein
MKRKNLQNRNYRLVTIRVLAGFVAKIRAT